MSITVIKKDTSDLMHRWRYIVPGVVISALIVVLFVVPIMINIDTPKNISKSVIAFWYYTDMYIVYGIYIGVAFALSWRLAYEHQRYHGLQRSLALSTGKQKKFIKSQRTTFSGLIIASTFGFVLLSWVVKRYLVLQQAFGDYIKWVYELGFIGLLLLISMIFCSLALRKLDKVIKINPNLRYPLKR